MWNDVVEATSGAPSRTPGEVREHDSTDDSAPYAGPMLRPPTPAAAACVAAVIVALSACSAEQDVDLPDPGPYAVEVFEAVNQIREGEGLEPLAWNDCLAEQAVGRADVAQHLEILAHEPIAVECTDGNIAGENLARLDVPASEMAQQWMGSPNHAENIRISGYRDAGVGCVDTGYALTCSWVAEGVSDGGGFVG